MSNDSFPNIRVHSLFLAQKICQVAEVAVFKILAHSFFVVEKPWDVFCRKLLESVHPTVGWLLAA